VQNELSKDKQVFKHNAKTPIDNLTMKFSEDGNHFIIERTETFIFPANYFMKVIDAEIQKRETKRENHE
jgi:hypothetical protein